VERSLSRRGKGLKDGIAILALLGYDRSNDTTIETNKAKGNSVLRHEI